MSQNVDDRSPTAKALAKVSEISSISLVMVVPAVLGHFVDRYFGTVVLFTFLGLVIGMVAAIRQLKRFVAHQTVGNQGLDGQASEGRRRE